MRRHRTLISTALLISVDEIDKFGVREILHKNLALIVNEFQKFRGRILNGDLIILASDFRDVHVNL